MAIATNSFDVDAADATKIATGRRDNVGNVKTVVVKNAGAALVLLGDESVDAATGFPLAADETLTLEDLNDDEELHAIADTGVVGTVAVKVLECGA